MVFAERRDGPRRSHEAGFPVAGYHGRMRVLVTGATGYLGRYIVEALADAGHQACALVRRNTSSPPLPKGGSEVEIHYGALEDEASLHEALRAADAVIHAAAHCGGWSKEDRRQRHVNVEGTAAILRAAQARKVERFVHVSTIVAIGMTREPRPIDEDEPWNGTRGPGLNYALTKRESDERVIAAARAGLSAVVVNPVSLLGVGAEGELRGGNCKAAFAGRLQRVIPGGGSVLAVQDCAQSCVAALTTGAVGERYILGGPNVTWLELGTAAARVAGHPPPRSAWPVAAGAVLAGVATALDVVHLSRPAFAPERFRTWGWYTFADSRRAEADLGHRARPLEDILAGLVRC